MHLVDRNNSNGFDREEPTIKNFESAAFHPSEDRKEREGRNEELMIHEERSRWDVGTVTKVN